MAITESSGDRAEIELVDVVVERADGTALRRDGAGRRIFAVLVLPIAASCAAASGGAGRECAAVAQRPCTRRCAAATKVRSLQALFPRRGRRERHMAHGRRVLVWRAPGSLRVKLFTLAG